MISGKQQLLSHDNDINNLHAHQNKYNLTNYNWKREEVMSLAVDHCLPAVRDKTPGTSDRDS